MSKIIDLVGKSFERKGQICLAYKVGNNFKITYFDRATKSTLFGLGTTGRGLDKFNQDIEIECSDIQNEENIIFSLIQREG